MATSTVSFGAKINFALSRAGVNADQVASLYAEWFEGEEVNQNNLNELLVEAFSGQVADAFIIAMEDKPDSFVGDYLWRKICSFGALATMIREAYDKRHEDGMAYVEEGFTDAQALADVASEFLSPCLVEEFMADAKAAHQHKLIAEELNRDIPELERWQLVDRELEFHARGGIQWDDHFDANREMACG